MGATDRLSALRSAVAGLLGIAVTGSLGAVTARAGSLLGVEAGLRGADLEAAVVLLVAAAGTVAAAAITLGCLLLTLAAARSGAGRVGAGLHRAGAVLTPAVLRRTLAVGVGLSLVASGAHASDGTSGSDGPELGWVVTSRTSSPDPLQVSDPPAVPTSSDAVAVAPVQPAAAPPAGGLGHGLAHGVGSSVAPAGDSGALDPAPTWAPGAVTDATVVVQPGDTLWAIARAHLPQGASDQDVAAAWPQWYAANSDVIGPDPDLIHPGQHLRPPATDLKEHL